MPIILPRASPSSEGLGGIRPRTARLPGPGDVPTITPPTDPGLRINTNVPAGAFGGQIGAAVEEFGGALTALAEVFEQQQRQYEATLVTEADVGFSGEVSSEYQRLQVEDDPSRPGFLTDFETFLGLGEAGGGLIEQSIGGLPQDVSDGAREALRLQLLRRARRIATQAGGLSLLAAQRRADDSVAAAINVTVAQAESFPDALPGILAETDQIIARFANTMTPDAERDQRTFARQANIEAAARGYSAAGRFPDARALLGDIYAEDLDPPARARIRATIERGERAENMIVRRAVADAVAVLEAGRLPTNLEGVEELAKGTDLATTLAEAIEDRAAVAAFVRRPLAEQVAVLAARPETTTRRALATEGRMHRAHRALREELKTGVGLSLAAELDVIEKVAPFDLSQPETLHRRALQARIASEHFGFPVSPLLPPEITEATRALDAAPADTAAGILEGLHRGLGRESTMALVAQIAPERPELAFATINAVQRPLLAREIILGGRLLKDNKDVAPGKPDRLEAIAEVFGTEDRSVFTPDTATALAPILDAATALYAARRVPTGDFIYDPDSFEDALREVTGGVFGFNGRNVLAPIPGMSEDAFEDAMERLTQPDLIEFGNGVPLFGNGDPFTVSHFESRFFGPEAQLVTAGFGRYLVSFPGMGFVMTEDGQPYDLDLAAFIRGSHE